MKKTAVLPSDYAQYAGFGQQGYNPGLDDPTRLPSQYYTEPKRYDEPPKWVGKTTAALIGLGLLGLLGKGVGKGLRWGAARRAARTAAREVPAARTAASTIRPPSTTPITSAESATAAGTIGKVSHIIGSLGSIARGEQ